MPTNVLIPIDGSEHSYAGLEYCLASFPDATITALSVIDPEYDHHRTVGSTEPPEQQAREAAEDVLEDARIRAETHSREIRTEIETDVPHRAILEAASEDTIDHVVMGSHGESPITRPFLGHVSETVVKRAPVSTTIVPELPDEIDNRELPGRVLVPVDGSEQATAALAYAMTEFPEAEITALHAIDLPFEQPRDEVEGTYVDSLLNPLESRADDVLSSASKRANEHGREIRTETVYGEPSRSIVEFVETDGIDQIVMGIHGRSLAARFVTGSVAERVAERSPITVTLVRGV